MIDVPVSPEMLQWGIQAGLTIPLMFYIAYHIRWGKIAEIYGNMGAIIKIMIAVARTNDDLREDEVREEFSPDDRAVADYIEDTESPKGNGDRTTIQNQD